MVWLTGKLCPPAQKLSKGIPKGPDPTIDEVDELIADLRGKGVCIDHDVNRVVGTIMDAWHNQNGLFVSLFVNDSNVETVNLVRKWNSAEMNGLSLGHDAMYIENFGTRHSKIAPIEVSLVKEGGVDQSRVVSFGDLNHAYVSQSGISRILGKSSHNFLEMSQATEEQNKPSTEEVIRNSPSNDEAQAMNKRARTVTDEAMQSIDLVTSGTKSKTIEEINAEKAIKFDQWQAKHNEKLIQDLLKNMPLVGAILKEFPGDFEEGTLAAIESGTLLSGHEEFRAVPNLVKVVAHTKGKYDEMKQKYAEQCEKMKQMEAIKHVPAPTLDAAQGRVQPPALPDDPVAAVMAAHYARSKQSSAATVTDSSNFSEANMELIKSMAGGIPLN